MSENTKPEVTENENSLEELFKELDQMIAQMESGELPLDQAFAVYEAGIKKIKQCNDKLDMIEKKMMALNNAGQTVEF